MDSRAQIVIIKQDNLRVIEECLLKLRSLFEGPGECEGWIRFQKMTKGKTIQEKNWP
jgi:hypothetical protein